MKFLVKQWKLTFFEVKINRKRISCYAIKFWKNIRIESFVLRES